MSSNPADVFRNHRVVPGDAAESMIADEIRRLEAERDALVEALRPLVEPDASYHGPEIHIQAGSHANAMRLMAAARAALTKVQP